MRGGVAGLCLSVLGAGALGCEEPIPVEPRYEPTIRTLFEAHCVRCHGAGGTVNIDPARRYNTTAMNGYLNRYDDQDCAPLPDGTPPDNCQRGARSEVPVMKVYVHETGVLRMPPEPSDPLTGWELELLDRWLANPLP